MSLLERTKLLLSVCTISRRELARNADVGFEWLRSFEDGRTEHPSVVRVQKLHDYLESSMSRRQESAA